MKKSTYIQTFCLIENNTVVLNGKELFASKLSPSFSAFAKELYRELGFRYPKFFKMDHLSKLTFLAAEVLLQNSGLSETDKKQIAIVLSNKSASLDTDRKHQETIQDPENCYPSPSIFVYTLPNIGTGEVCIRHGIQGENAFFVFSEFNPAFLKTYATSLLQLQKAKHILCGWVDVDKEAYKAFVYLVSEEGTFPNDDAFINKNYTNN